MIVQGRRGCAHWAVARSGSTGRAGSNYIEGTGATEALRGTNGNGAATFIDTP
jgi:hypothetical protein